MPESEDTNQGKRADDPAELMQALELELIQQRAAWQKVSARRGTWRALSVLFLLLVGIGAVVAYLYLVPQLRSHADEKRSPLSESDH